MLLTPIILSHSVIDCNRADMIFPYRTVWVVAGHLSPQKRDSSLVQPVSSSQ